VIVLPQYNTPLGPWNFGIHGMSEHNPGFDSLFHRVMALDSNWHNAGGAVMVNRRLNVTYEGRTLQETLQFILSLYEEAE